MGQKTNPIGNRLGIIRGWESNWYGGNDYGDKLAEDDKIRKYIHARLSKASVSKMRIQEKEIAKLKAKITEKKKELLKFEKARAKAMFAEKPKDKVDPSTLNGKSRDKIENNNSESIEDVEKKEKDASVDSDNTAGQSKRMQKRVSFASNLEERHEIVEEEEEDDPWYEEHKEAFILLAIGGLAFASVFARTRRS